MSTFLQDMPMKPILKWAGGKRAIASELQNRFPPQWNNRTYFEPFIGGAAVFLQVQPKYAKISDLNRRLVELYIHIKTNPKSFYDSVQAISQKFNLLSPEIKGEYFYQLREDFNNSEADSIESAAIFYALNKLCFNGLYRENSSGKYNVPFGNKKSFPTLSYEEVEALSKRLSKAEIKHCDFADAVSAAKEGDFVYFDPPYIPLNPTSSFTSYNSDGFGEKEQRKLASVLIELGDRGVLAMCSNSDTELTREIYGSLNVSVIQAPRMVSAKGSGRGSNPGTCNYELLTLFCQILHFDRDQLPRETVDVHKKLD
jgi:DNA adenine methylase